MKIKNVEIYYKIKGRWVDSTDKFFEDDSDKKRFIKHLIIAKPLTGSLIRDIMIDYNYTEMFYRRFGGEIRLFDEFGDIVVGGESDDNILVHIVV